MNNFKQVDISKLSPIEAARRIHVSRDLHFNPFTSKSRDSVLFCDEILRLTSEEVLASE